MSHFNDFMDGVPVKISEKYIRPQRIDLPYSVNECTSRAQHALDSTKYCGTFEKNVLAKIKELRSAKETKKSERKHRLQLLEEAKQQKLDAIAAAEAEEKLKQLSVSEVSYPSTEEISEISPDDKSDKNCDNALKQDHSVQPETVISSEQNYPSCCTQEEPQPNILRPIQVQSNYPASSLLDDPDPLQELKMQSKAVQIPHYNSIYNKHNVEGLTYKDFENDTSSPFDNVELKTINEMEQLAQVLQRQSTTSCLPQQPYVAGQTYMDTPNCMPQANADGVMYVPNPYMEQPMQDSGMMYTSPQHYPVTNGYYIPNENCENTIPIENMNMYGPNCQYFVPVNPYLPNPYYNQGYPLESSDISNESSIIPHPYGYNYPQIQCPYEMRGVNTQFVSPNIETAETAGPSALKSRSRSVPDIMKELNEEINLAKQRATERSYNVSPAPKEVRPASSQKKDSSRKKFEQLPNPINKLSGKLQNMCKRIHGMGFPLDRVARICTLVGDNDKKIIEGLLIMGELMDLGFSEGKVSAALVKHEFNRDKALDELVS